MIQHRDNIPAQPSPSQPEARVTFNVILAYDHKRAATRALALCDSIARELSPDAWSEPWLCRLDLLGCTPFREAASQAAANADMIVVAFHQQHHFDSCTAQVELLAKSAREGAALVCLFDDLRIGDASFVAIQLQLERIAQQARLGLFVHGADDGLRNGQRTLGPESFRAWMALAPRLSARGGMRSIHPTREWGINE